MIRGVRPHRVYDRPRSLDTIVNRSILPGIMKTLERQLGLSTAATGRKHSYANAPGNGGDRLYAISADSAFIRCGRISTNRGEPMT